MRESNPQCQLGNHGECSLRHSRPDHPRLSPDRPYASSAVCCDRQWHANGTRSASLLPFFNRRAQFGFGTRRMTGI